MHWFVKFLYILLGIWYLLALIKPSRFAPFMKTWPFIKGICIGLIISIPLIALNEVLLSPEEKAEIYAQQQQSKIARELDENIYAKNLNLNSLDEANSVKSILESVGITAPSEIKHDNDLDNSTNGVKGYRLTSDGNSHIILYMNPNNTVNSIRYLDIYLYADNTLLQKISNIYLSSDQKYYMKNTTEKAISMLLKTPKTAQFSKSKETHYSIDNGIATIQGYVDAQNSFGAQIRSTYWAQFNVNNNMEMTHLTFDGNTIL